MSELRVFSHNDFGELETILIDGKPYFPATRCAEMLEYEKPHDAISRHCRYSVKHGVPHPQNPNKTIEKNFIPQGDLVRLVTHSRLPAARDFESWVMDIIVPSVLNTGMYGRERLLTDPDLLLEVVQNWKNERDLRIQTQEALLLEGVRRKALAVRLDEAEQWMTIKRYAHEHNLNWRFVGDPTGRGLGWRKLKALSHEHGYDIHRSFDANYGVVNAYHSSLFTMI
jgi:prophage antirepressor-like protein